MSTPASKKRKIPEPTEHEAERDLEETNIPDEEKSSEEDDYIVESEETEKENDDDLEEEKTCPYCFILKANCTERKYSTLKSVVSVQ